MKSSFDKKILNDIESLNQNFVGSLYIYTIGEQQFGKKKFNTH